MGVTMEMPALKKCIYCAAESAAPKKVSIGDSKGVWRQRHHVECGACNHMSPGFFEKNNNTFEAQRKAFSAWNYMEYKP